MESSTTILKHHTFGTFTRNSGTVQHDVANYPPRAAKISVLEIFNGPLNIQISYDDSSILTITVFDLETHSHVHYNELVCACLLDISSGTLDGFIRITEASLMESVAAEKIEKTLYTLQSFKVN
jgi:hypothetical protein